jgi:peroxiredoxin
MKQMLFFLWALTPCICRSQDAVIGGLTTKALVGKQLQLVLLDYSSRQEVLAQQVVVGQSGKFTFNVRVREPAIFELRSKENALGVLLAKPGETIELEIDKTIISASGSAETSYLIGYENERRRLFQHFLRPAYDSSALAFKSGDKKRVEDWKAALNIAREKYQEELGRWVSQPFFINSLAAVHHSLRWNPDKDTLLIREMIKNFSSKYGDAELTRQLLSKVTSTKRTILGAPAPAFKAITAEGRALRTGDYRGKYVLIDFWASWCGPCRQESSALVSVFDTFHSKGFDIISVSIDTDPNKWRTAIKKDNYHWANVSALGGYQDPLTVLYNISAIPANFLLDPSGKIVAKNLDGNALQEKLSRLLGTTPLLKIE